jgi:hypothetical protein
MAVSGYVVRLSIITKNFPVKVVMIMISSNSSSNDIKTSNISILKR